MAVVFGSVKACAIRKKDRALEQKAAKEAAREAAKETGELYRYRVVTQRTIRRTYFVDAISEDDACDVVYDRIDVLDYDNENMPNEEVQSVTEIEQRPVSTLGNLLN